MREPRLLDSHIVLLLYGNSKSLGGANHRYIILSYMLHLVKYQFREIEELLSNSDY